MPVSGVFGPSLIGPSNVFRHQFRLGEMIVRPKGSASRAKSRRKMAKDSRRHNRG